nr:MAG TPA: hypothetical protein [Caudoviricetes sp.]
MGLPDEGERKNTKENKNMKATQYRFNFACRDNGGKYQSFAVSASTKYEAIHKAFKKANKAAAGSITSWECRLARLA